MYGNHFAPNSKRHIRQPGCMKTFKGMYLSIEVNLGLSTQSQFSIIKNHSYPDIGVKLLGVWGNEIVDSSANKGAQSRFIESEAHSGLIKSNLKELIFNKNLALHATNETLAPLRLYLLAMAPRGMKCHEIW